MTSGSVSRGAFIVLEGVDRCGKTTQVARLVDRLQKEQHKQPSHDQDSSTAPASRVVPMRFPDRTTPIGRIIHEYLTSSSSEALDDAAIHLLFSANRWEASSSIQQHLKQGRTIVCDRYVHSGVAFSAAKVKGTSGRDAAEQPSPVPCEPLLSLDWCQAPDRGLPAPDLVIFLDMAPENAEARGGYGEERYEKRDMQLRVRQLFHELRDRDLKDQRVPWVTIDAAQSMDQVEQEIYQSVQATLEQVRCGKPLEKMWQDGQLEL